MENITYGIVDGITTRDGERVLYYDVSTWDPSSFHFEDFIGAGLLINDIMSADTSLIDPGFVIIMDMEKMTMKHMTASNPKTFAKGAKVAHESMITREKKYYCINYSLPLELAMRAIKPFLVKKAADTFIFLKKEKMMEVLGQDVVENKKYIPPPGGLQSYRQTISEGIPIFLKKYQKIML